MTTTPISSVGAQASNAAAPDMAKLRKAAQAFEAVFLRQMIGSMRSASLGDGILDSSATEQFRDMSDSQTADAMASKGVLGVADLLVKQLGARMAPKASGGKAPE